MTSTAEPDVAGRDLDRRHDETVPTGPWAFDEKVTTVFDDMLARSIPDYGGMRTLTTKLAARYAQPGTAVVDLGCSRGGSLAPIIEAVGDACSYVGVEVSEPMRSAAVANLGPRFTALDLDLRTSFPKHRASVVLSVLTLQFVPIEYRQRIIADVYESLWPGGAFLLVEKVLGDDSHLDATLVDAYLSMKGANGYTQEQISSKRTSLEGVLVPITAAWNRDLLDRSGFRHVDCFWRHLNFAGWLAVK